ncbi:hypothetical protein CGLO_16340 [Colletotrichum gloeosporioides Cg-14]|uniref:Uncharacterized protein n=1 Tax=Colletotrichum gloeosporioides (strain Cg-14) TaxID=1237896 RepID=T0JNU5_COLGC|nr:hypothetical protein CGLO_16340 [Colletotrichum gloeosporioides Cg-14]
MVLSSNADVRPAANRLLSQGINFVFQAGRPGVKPAGARVYETLQDRPRKVLEGSTEKKP